MIYIKTDAEVELLRESNLLVSRTLAEVAGHIRPGVTTLRLDSIAETFIQGSRRAARVQGLCRFSQHALHIC